MTKNKIRKQDKGKRIAIEISNPTSQDSELSSFWKMKSRKFSHKPKY